MVFCYNNKEYEIIIERKKIKNMYLKVKEDLKIYISCNRFVSQKSIEKLINDNYKTISQMIENINRKKAKNNEFYLLGQKYDVIKISNITKVSIDNNKIYTKDDQMLEKWLRINTLNLFEKEFNKCINNFKEPLPTVNLKIRTMKSRWGVCNRKNNNVTLNSHLIRYEIPVIDYVIYHELAHFIHPNHSSNFWNLVNFYVKDYKIYRNKLKN